MSTLRDGGILTKPVAHAKKIKNVSCVTYLWPLNSIKNACSK